MVEWDETERIYSEFCSVTVSCEMDFYRCNQLELFIADNDRQAQNPKDAKQECGH